MAIAAVIVGVDVIEGQRNHSRRVGAVDDRDDALPPGRRAQFPGRQHQAGWGQHVAEEEYAGMFGECGTRGVDDFSRRLGKDRQGKGAEGQTLALRGPLPAPLQDRKSTRLNSSHEWISYAVFCLKKKKKTGK